MLSITSTVIHAKQLVMSTTLPDEKCSNKKTVDAMSKLYQWQWSYPFVTFCFFLAKQGIIHVPQLLYSPDLALYNFWLFPKSDLKRKRFPTIHTINENILKQLMVISKWDLENCFKKWKRRISVSTGTNLKKVPLFKHCILYLTGYFPNKLVQWIFCNY